MSPVDDAADAAGKLVNMSADAARNLYDTATGVLSANTAAGRKHRRTMKNKKSDKKNRKSHKKTEKKNRKSHKKSHSRRHL